MNSNNNPTTSTMTYNAEMNENSPIYDELQYHDSMKFVHDNNNLLYSSDEYFNKIEFKYCEDGIISDLKTYIRNTYSEHYKTDDIEPFDAWIAKGSATDTFLDNALKYIWRYGKKEGKNKKDLMKALHYVILALYNDHYKG